MALSKENIMDYAEKYEKVQKLLDNSKHDPPSEPYLSKYAAKVILQGMEESLKFIKISISVEDENKVKCMLGFVYLTSGVISVETDELATGEKYLKLCIEELQESPAAPEYICLIVNAYNQLGILWSMREDAAKSKEYLDKSFELYTTFKKTDCSPIDISVIFVPESIPDSTSDGVLYLEKSHTLTLYYLAQIYGTLGNDLKSSVFCHITLKRQLQFKDYDHIDWALNAATLSQYFTEKNGFKQARHHLAAASFILEEYDTILQSSEDDEDTISAKLEIYRHRSADVARCWAKYGLCLLQNSWERLLHHADDDETAIPCSLSSDLAKLQLDSDYDVTTNDLQSLTFTSILHLSIYENQVTNEFVLTFEDARLVFLNIQMWLQRAKEYYTLDNLASEYALIVLDISSMYKYLALFEDDEDRQCKMHKRRIDQLEELIKELNPTYYLAICRQIWNELALAYSNILDFKLDKLKNSTERPSPHALIKINNLVEKGIGHYRSLLDSLKHPKTKQMPDTFEENIEAMAIIGAFLLARLYNKYITPDKAAQIEHITYSVEYYRFVVDYCKKNASAAEKYKIELGVSQEMATLLPLKIKKLQQELIN